MRLNNARLPSTLYTSFQSPPTALFPYCQMSMRTWVSTNLVNPPRTIDPLQPQMSSLIQTASDPDWDIGQASVLRSKCCYDNIKLSSEEIEHILEWRAM